MTVRVRIGDIMRECGLSRAKATYYTAFGLLKTVGKVDTGANLYDLDETIKRVNMIKELKSKRLMLKEIKKEINKKFSARA
jgi:DNA-binding transcriptional MerR regulator